MNERARRFPFRLRVHHLLTASLVLLFALQILRTAWVSDDAFITLRTIDNAIHGYGLRWNVGERVQTFTHPLWMLLVTPVYAAIGDPYYAVLLVSLAISLTAIVVLAFSSGLAPRSVALAIAVLALSKAYVDYSTSGLENPLTHLLVLLLALALLGREDWEATAPRIGLIAGLLGLTRLDLLALAAPAVALALLHSSRVRTRWMTLAGFIPLALWELFSLFYYGSLVPNTVIAKVQTGVPAAELVEQGIHYLRNSLAWDPITLVVVALAIVCAVADRRERPVALAAGIVLYLVLIVAVGGDFMSGRFLTGPLIAAVALLASRPWPQSRLFAPATAAAIAVIAALAPRPSFSVSLARELSRIGVLDPSGIADERRYYFSSQGLFNGAPGWKRPTVETRLRGQDLSSCGAPVAVDVAVGAVGFFAGPKVHVVDVVGLGDPLLSRLPMVAADPSYASFMRSLGVGAPLRPWRIGHFRRNLPAGYLRALLTGANTIKDPDVARLWDRVRLVTRGRLFDLQRLRNILRTNLGLDRTAVRSGREPFRSTDWTEVLDLLPGSPEGLYQLGRTQLDRGQFTAAARTFDEVLRACPTHSQALRVGGDMQLRLRDFARAETLGRRAIVAYPSAQFGYLLTSVALADQRKFEAAAAILTDLAQRDRTAAAAAWELAGEVWIAAGDLERARSSLMRSLELDPELKDAAELLRRLPR